MPSTILLIRHAAHDLLGRAITGRMPGVHLNEEGKRQAEALADRLAAAPIGAVYSGPLERALETAGPIAGRLGLPVLTADAADEVDFGDWTGCKFQDVDRLDDWRRFNAYRSGTRIPNGELVLEIQARMVVLIERLARQHRGETIVIVSHGDVIRSALAYYLGMPLDLLQRLEVGPASISTLAVDEHGAQLLDIRQFTAPWPSGSR